MISVVVVTYNSEGCVGACIDTVMQHLPDAELLVVDNASTDDSRDIAERHGASVMGLDRNLGFGRACNAGAARATHEHVLFLNPDVAISYVRADQLRALLEAPDFGLVVPSSTGSGFTFTERGWLGETLSLAFRALRPRELPRREPSSRGGRARWASGAALLVRKAEFLAIGGFDARYFLYYEDRDLSWRYRQRGLPLRITSALVGDHVGGGSSVVGNRRSNIGAFAMIGWIEYRYVACGHAAARRSWVVLHRVHAGVTHAVSCLARVVPLARLTRKSLQLCEVAQELERIRASSGVLEQSDDHGYWPDAVVVLGASTR